MVEISSISDRDTLKDGNRIIGDNITLNNSVITFWGKNNTLYCEDDVVIVKSNIKFRGDNNIIFLSNSIYQYKLIVTTFNGSVFYMGNNNSITKPMTVVLSEGKNVFFGDNCRIALGVSIRNSDAHLMYDCVNKKRINNSKSIYIGDHVWIGQESMFLKGGQVDSGSIIGAKSIISNKIITNNSICVSSGKIIKKGVFWDKQCTHKYTEEKTINSFNYDNINADVDEWCYSFSQGEYISFNDIEKNIDASKNDSETIIRYLCDLPKYKNRFVRDEPISKSKMSLSSFFIKRKNNKY